MDFLELSDKTILVFGVANRKSVAYFIGRTLEQLVHACFTPFEIDIQKQQVAKLLGDADVLTCDVESKDQIELLRNQVKEKYGCLHGIVHSIAFADYEGEVRPFHHTRKDQFLRAVDISCFLADCHRRSLSATACRGRLRRHDLDFDHADGQ